MSESKAMSQHPPSSPDGDGGGEVLVSRRLRAGSAVICDPHSETATTMACSGHAPDHVHGVQCSHPLVQHEGHYDFLVGDHLHHPHDGHCDHHGVVENAAQLKQAPSCSPLDVRPVMDEQGVPDDGTKWYNDSNAMRFFIMIFLTGGFFFVELIVGIAIQSLALQADAFHMASDLLALITGFMAARVSRRGPSAKVTYGWKGIEVIAALINGVFLLATCFNITLEALDRFRDLDELEDTLGESADELLIVACIGLLINLMGLCIFHDGHSHGGHGHSHGDASGGHGHSHGEANGSGQGPSHPELSIADNSRVVAAGKASSAGAGAGTGAGAGAGAGGTGAEPGTIQAVIVDVVPPPSPARVSGMPQSTCAESTEPNLERGTSNQADGNDSNTTGNSTESTAGPHGEGANLNVHGVLLHVLGDALGSVGVIISALVIKYFDGSERLVVDPVVSLFIVAIIVYGTWPLVRKTVDVLLHKVPDSVDIPAVRGQLMAVPGVVSIHELHVWQLGGSKYIGTLHLLCAGSADVSEVVTATKRVFHTHGVHNTTIQPEFLDDCADGADPHCHEPVCPDDEGCANQLAVR